MILESLMIIMMREVLVSYDKEITKIILNSHNIPQVKYITLHNDKHLKNIDIDFMVCYNINVMLK